MGPLVSRIFEGVKILELGSGGGHNASHLKAHYELTLVDIAPEMLDVSRALNPECEHLEGDMTSVRLESLFDGVFVHDAVGYLTREADLAAAMETAAAHCRWGGCTTARSSQPGWSLWPSAS